ncbi:MAG: hypothetical protein JSW61_04020 [Candidatus Thorarchaeota archaeon]|nr:MAG: hypothetical protein JSW61_04020 [Candidatus Thorarchaeota archaeon]
MTRPTGISILAIIQLLSSLLYLVIGGLAVWVAFELGGILGIFAAFFSLILFIIGLIGLIIFWGLWNLKTWAYWLALFLNLLALLTQSGDIYGNIFSFAVSLIVVIYLLVPQTRNAFY